MNPDDIKAWREGMGWTQQALADALSVDGRVAQPTVSRWESGTRRPPPFLRLALAILATDPQEAR